VMGFDLATGDLEEGWRPDTLGQIGGWAIYGAPDGCLWIGGDFNRRAIGDQWRNSVQRYCSEAGQGAPVGPPLIEPSKPETNPPSVPGGFAAADNGDNTVDLSWNASTDDTAVMYYRIYRNGQYLQATRGLSLTDMAAGPGDTYTVRAVDAYETESADSVVQSPVLAGLPDPFINAGFDGSEEGFVYSDDLFYGTSEPGYADGLVRRYGGDPAGNLMVFLGGYDHSDIFGMSGAWEKTFELPTAMDVQISLDYRLSVSDGNENSEWGEALLAIDGTLIGNGGDDYIDQIAGGGDSGWTTFSTVVSLSAGTHTLSVGGYHNKKTYRNEIVEVSFDEIVVAPVSPFVGFTAPAEGATLAGTVAMELRATDLSDGSNQLVVDVSSDGGSNWDPATWNAATGRFDFDLDVSAVADGPLDLMARAEDTDNNITTITSSFNVDNDGDPSATIINPTEGASVTGTIVRVDASDPEDPPGTLDVEVRTDVVTWSSAAWNAGSARYEYSWDTTSNGDGPATVEARVTDSAPVTVNATPVNVTVISSPGSEYADAVIADGADVYWRVAESSGTTAIDETGGNDADYAGSPTLGVSGIITGGNTAVSFDGIDDKINIVNATEINQGGPYTTKTIELWFNATDVSRRQVLLEQGSVNRGLNIYLDGGQLYAGVYNTANDGGDTPWGPVWLSTPVTAGTDYQVAMVFDVPSDTLSLYVNGALVDSDNGIGSLNSHALSAVGAQRSWARYVDGGTKGADNFFGGTIDEIASYPTALNAGTIATHYTAGIS